MRLLLPLWLLAFLSWTSPAALASTPSNEWVLKQKAQDTGEHTVYITPDAVKIVCNSGGYNILAKAPAWQVYCYRPDSKEYWTGDLEQFNGIIMINPFAVPSIKTEVLSDQTKVTYKGHQCTRYTKPKLGRPVVMVADDIEVSAKACELLCRYYYVTKMTKVPVYRLVKAIPHKAGMSHQWLDANVARDLRSGDRVALDTDSWKKIVFNAADFEYPKDYKRIKDINQVGYSSARRDALGDMIGEIGFTSDAKKDAAQKDAAKKTPATAK